MKLSHSLSLLAVSFLMAGSADAASVVARHSANNCAYETDYIGDYLISTSSISNGSGNRARNLYCPLNDGHTVQYIAVDGYDANNDPSVGVPTARICQAEPVGHTISCTASVALLGGTSTGLFSTWLPTWMIAPLQDSNRVSWYAELVVTLPQAGIYGKSFLRGYFRT